MAIVLDDTDPVFGGEAQKQGLAKSPAPVTPAPTPLDIYDYQQYSDPYTAVPGSQGYAAPVAYQAPIWESATQTYRDPASGLLAVGSDQTGWRWVTDAEYAAM